MKIGFLGTPSHSAHLLESLVESGHTISFAITNPDKPTGRGGATQPPPVKTTAQKYGIPVFQESIKSDQAKEFLSQHPSDIQIVFAYGSIIPRSVFDLPIGGTINLHGSLLPEYRGASPVQSAILDGKSKTGISLQYIVEELDAGDLISSIETDILPSDNFGTLLDRLTDLGTKELLRLLSTFEGKKFPAHPQDSKLASFCKKIKVEDRKLQFSKTAHDLHNQIRAFNPGNICFTSFRDKRLNVYQTEVFDRDPQSPAGTYVQVDKKTPGIATIDHKILVLLEIQPENKKRMSGVDFINGNRPANGEYFQ